MSQNYTNWKNKIIHDIDIFKGEIIWYFLVDPNAHMYLPNLLLENSAIPLFLNTYNNDFVAMGPHILKLNPESDFFTWVFDYIERLPLGIIIGSRLGNEEKLYEHLQKVSEYEVEGRHFIFRFYDPRMLYGLITWPNQDDKNYVLKEALFFEAWEPGRSQAIYLESNASCQFPENYQLNYELMEHLYNESIIHSIIGSLEGEAGDKLRDKNLAQAYSFVEQSANIVANYGYKDYDDIVVSTIISITNGINIWNEEKVKTLLSSNTKNYSLRIVMG